MIEKRENGLLMLQFPNFMSFPEIHHGIFTRSGGYSPRPFDSLNVSFHVGDEKKHVERNRQAILSHIKGGQLIFVKQDHGDHVLIVDEKSTRKNDDDLQVADAMITDKPNFFLTIQVADCQAIVLYDPIARVVANIHSGWRGSIRNVIARTIEKMAFHFSTVPQNLVAAISPSLGPCCAEFVHYRDEIPELFWKYKNPSDHFDFWAISRDQLISAGIKEENLYVSQICTKCHTDRFYSYRDETVTGRFAVFIGLIEK